MRQLGVMQEIRAIPCMASAKLGKLLGRTRHIPYLALPADARKGMMLPLVPGGWRLPVAYDFSLRSEFA